MDFSEPTRVGERIEQLKPKLNGYDHNYILSAGKDMKMAARLIEPKSGRSWKCEPLSQRCSSIRATI
jgi:galactose mutarotase-like enzyme